MADGNLKLERFQWGKRAVSREISPADGGMEKPSEKDLAHYWADGHSALDLIAKAMTLSGRAEFQAILDFPSGYGRVLRHLVEAFPDAIVDASDIDPHALHFCREIFRIETILSSSDLANFEFERRYDLIWCGSLLTHLPKHRFHECLALFARSLMPDGVAIFTTHGRYSARFGRDTYLPADRFDRMHDAYLGDGFGYADYDDEDGPLRGEYGVSLSSPSFVCKALEPLTDIRLLALIERGWNDHQDAVVVQKKRL